MLDDQVMERSFSEQGLPTAGSVRASVHKGMRGYVRPTPGSAEDVALKRSRSRGATGMVLKVRYRRFPAVAPMAPTSTCSHPHFQALAIMEPHKM